MGGGGGRNSPQRATNFVSECDSLWFQPSQFQAHFSYFWIKGEGSDPSQGALHARPLRHSFPETDLWPVFPGEETSKFVGFTCVFTPVLEANSHVG